MARVSHKKTLAVHESCADKPHSEIYTWRTVMIEWAFDHQLAVFGLSKTNPRDYEKIKRLRVEVGLIVKEK